MSDTERHVIRASGKRHGQAGFSLAELVVSLFVVVLLLVVILTLFDTTSKVARAQTYVADVQQSVRVAQDEMVRLTRIAARGGLTRGTLPDGLITVEVRDNVADASPDQQVAKGAADSPLAMPDTDILTVRGVFDHLYFLNSDPGGGAVTFDNPDNPTEGTLIVQNPIPSTGIAQSLQALIKYKDPPDNNRPEAILIASPLGGTLYHVVQLDPGGSDFTNPSRLVLKFKVTGGTHSVDYNSVSANTVFPPELRSVAYIGIVEEYRYYIRKVVDPANPTAVTQRLTQTRFYPGSENIYYDQPGDNAKDRTVDIADDVVDLQVALAIDKNGDGAIAPETFDTADEWLYNATGDAAALNNPTEAALWNASGRKLYYVRINTLARTARRDPYAVSLPISKIEDHAYNELPYNDPSMLDPNNQRQYRRRLLQTVVDLRNL